MSQPHESKEREVCDRVFVGGMRLNKGQVQYLLHSLWLLLLPPPAMLSISISSLCLSFLPEVSLSQRTQAFLTRLQRLNDWCVQTTTSGRDDMHPDPLTPPSPHALLYTYQICPSCPLCCSVSPCLSLAMSVPLHEVGYTSRCPGNPGPAHYSAPLRHSSL